MQTWRFALHKSHDVAGSQAREVDSTVTETAFEKITDEWQVVDDRCVGQGARFSQVLLVCLRALLRWGQSRSCYPLGENHAALEQNIDEMLKRSGVSRVNLHALTTISQVLCGVSRPNAT
jgi:hypothetical protein